MTKAKTLMLDQAISIGLTTNDFHNLLNDGRNVELVARLLKNNQKNKNWALLKDPLCPQRLLMQIGKCKFLIRMKTSKGFDLAPSKMKGTQRKRNIDEALNFVKSKNFLLIDSTGDDIKYRIIKKPTVTRLAKIDSPI